MSGKRKPRQSEEGQQSFEQALERLEAIAARLEDGNVSLEEAISLAEEGLKLSQFCEKQLSEAEGKIEQLVERMGAVAVEPLSRPEEEEA